MTQPMNQPPPVPPSPVRRAGVPGPVILIGLGVLLLVGYIGYSVTRPPTPKAQPATTTLAPDTNAAAPATADQTESNDGSETSSPQIASATPSPPATTLTQAQANDFLQNYFTLAPRDPRAAFQQLTAVRQSQENFDGFVAFWESVDSVSINVVGVDGNMVRCNLTYLMDSGKSSTENDARIWLWLEGGNVRLDTPGPGSSPEQTAARMQLEDLREGSLYDLHLDGLWVVVLSTKRAGIKDDAQVAANGSHYFYETDILSLHGKLLAQFSGELTVLMLKSTDFGKQPQYPTFFWRTVGDGRFPSKESATAWCQSHFSGSADVVENSCLASQLVEPHS